MEKEDLLPDIEEYLKSVDDNIPVSISGLEFLVAKVVANTGLPEETCKILVREIFQQIRNEVLDGNCVVIKGLGKFFITHKNNKKKMFIKFKTFKKLKNRLNDE